MTSPPARHAIASTHEANTIISALDAALSREGIHEAVTHILNREPNIYSSTFPSEILTCRFNDGSEKRVFWKRQSSEWKVYGHGHRRGVPYEARFYREILHNAPVPTPRFLGTYDESDTGQVWMFIEYIESATHLNKADIQHGLLAAAHWLGVFHARNESEVHGDRLTFLIRYDADYYQGWIARTLEHTRHAHKNFAWLPDVCGKLRDAVDILLAEPLTVIHSEFYPRNILARNGDIYPVDWESAAIAAGEIDLACLTEGWGAEDVEQCESVYCKARWKAPDVAAFSKRMSLARMYQEFRWLGDEHQSNEWGSQRIERVGRLAKKLGFM